jgi:acetyl-CoA C-acetyltransferase
MDTYALHSHQRAAAAQDRGAFQREIAPVRAPQPRVAAIEFAADECFRRDTSLEKLAKLAPAFRPDGRVTAGNASGLSDGAAALVLMRRDTARELGCAPLARYRGYDQAAVKPSRDNYGPGFRHRPVCCKRRGWRWPIST